MESNFYFRLSDINFFYCNVKLFIIIFFIFARKLKSNFYISRILFKKELKCFMISKLILIQISCDS